MVSSSSHNERNENQVPNIDNESFKEGMNDSNAVLLDVRTPKEHSEKRIPNSILIDFQEPDFADAVDQLDKTKSYFVYCRSGNRSFHAGNLMLKKGFTDVYNLAMGILEWNGETESDQFE